MLPGSRHIFIASARYLKILFAVCLLKGTDDHNQLVWSQQLGQMWGHLFTSALLIAWLNNWNSPPRASSFGLFVFFIYSEQVIGVLNRVNWVTQAAPNVLKGHTKEQSGLTFKEQNQKLGLAEFWANGNALQGGSCGDIRSWVGTCNASLLPLSSTLPSVSLSVWGGYRGCSPGLPTRGIHHAW